jgi:hypothetical protein
VNEPSDFFSLAMNPSIWSPSIWSLVFAHIFPMTTIMSDLLGRIIPEMKKGPPSGVLRDWVHLWWSVHCCFCSEGLLSLLTILKAFTYTMIWILSIIFITSRHILK